MPSFICMLVNSPQNSFWDITLCDPKGNRVIQAVRYYYHSLFKDVKMEMQGDLPETAEPELGSIILEFFFYSRLV